jgi:hypothetical protein
MSKTKTGPRQLKPAPYRAYALAWQYDGSHVIQWCDKSKGGEHWRRLDEQCNGRFPEPDAKLMAAGHDMLSALRMCADFLAGPTAWTAEQESELCKRVHAAIAKATAGTFSLITGDAPVDAQ